MQYGLTDKYLVYGLALCKNLARITLCYVKGKGRTTFSDAGLNCLQQARNYIVRDLSNCHGREKHWRLRFVGPPRGTIEYKSKRFIIAWKLKLLLILYLIV